MDEIFIFRNTVKRHYTGVKQKLIISNKTNRKNRNNENYTQKNECLDIFRPSL